ncbi:TonB family protein [Salmonella enterica]|nr:TonB family protein [Salmonella enterica]EHQ4622815.1 TonB family protein [Salmonella enterica]
MSVYKSAGLLLILMSVSFSSFSSNLNSASSPVCTSLVPFSPVYPYRALALKIEGRVKFTYDVDSSGKVVDIRILDAQPHNMFERSIKNALKLLRFDCGGIPLKGPIVNYVFRLPSDV